MIPPQKPKYSLTRHPSWNLLSRYQPTITLFGGLYFCYELTGRELAILDARDRVERDQIEADRGKMQINDRPHQNHSEDLRRHAFGGGDLGREGVSPVEMSGAGQSGN